MQLGLKTRLLGVGYAFVCAHAYMTQPTHALGVVWLLGVAAQPVSWASLAVLIGGGAGVLAYWNFVREREKTKGAVVWWPPCCRVGVHAADFVGPDAAVAHKVTSYGKPALGGPFELVNQRGEPVTDASYQGEYLLLYFGFTYCPDICPSELVKMGKVVEQLGTIDIPAHAPALRRSRGGHSQMARKASRRCARCSFPSTLTETPSLKWRRMCKVRCAAAGDGLLSRLAHSHRCVPIAVRPPDFHPRFEALTGTPQQIGRAAKHYRVYFSDVDREEDDDDYVGMSR